MWRDGMAGIDFRSIQETNSSNEASKGTSAISDYGVYCSLLFAWVEVRFLHGYATLVTCKYPKGRIFQRFDNAPIGCMINQPSTQNHTKLPKLTSTH
jgi:hypothetical protein